MMRTVHLHGALGREFGKSFQFDIMTAGEAFRALNVAFPSRFVEALKIGSYHVIRGRRHGGMHLDEDQLNSFSLGHADLHIVPAVKGAGSGKGGAIKTILGVALIGAAIFFSGGTLAAPLAGMGSTAFGIGGMAITWGNIGMLGLGLALSGISQLIAPSESSKSEDDDKSYSFGGPVNVNEQGNAIPLIYGECIVGSQPISAGFDIEDLNATKAANVNAGVPDAPVTQITEDPVVGP